MRKLNILLLTIPGLYFAQLASPLGQIQATTNPETKYIGIGTTTPESRLDIRADESIPIIRGNGGYIPTGLRFIDDSYTQPGQVKEWAIWKGNTFNKGLSFHRYDAVNPCGGGICDVVLQLNDNGNVGINMAQPEAKLHIAGGHGDTSILMRSSGNGSDVPAYLNLWASEPTLTYSGVGIGNNVRFWNPKTNTPGLSRFAENLGGSYIRLLDNSINFNTITSSGHATMAVNIVDNGNMAIGTNVPSTKLEVYNEASMGHLTLSGNDNGANDYSRIDLDYKIKSTGHVVGRVSSFYLDSGNGGSGGLRFFTREAGQLKEKMWIAANGNVSISNKLEAKEIKVTNSPTADFVFEDTYQLPKLENVEKHIKEKKHLPEIASAAEMRKEGVNIGEFQIKLLQKIEELTLYSIEQNKQLTQQKTLNRELLELIQKMENRINILENKQ